MVRLENHHPSGCTPKAERADLKSVQWRFESADPDHNATCSCGIGVRVEVESRPNLYCELYDLWVEYELSADIYGTFWLSQSLDRNNKQLSGGTISCTAATACRVLTLEKRTCCATTQVYGFGNYPTKNKLHRKTWICLLNYHFWDNMWRCGWTVYKRQSK